MRDHQNTNAATPSGDETELLQMLSEAVGLPVAVWRREDSDGPVDDRAAWCRLSADGPDKPVAALAEAVAGDGAAWSVEPEQEEIASVAMRLSPRGRACASVQLPREQAERTVRLFDTVALNHRLKRQQSELNEENDLFAGQLASDLEELSFLRSIVDQLAGARVDEQFLALAVGSLPVLNATVRAECLVLFELPRAEDPYTVSVSACEGQDSLPHATLEEVVRRFGPQATSQTVVHNWESDDMPAGSTPEAENRLPGVRSLVLAPLKSGTRVLGWLAAINRRSVEDFSLTSSWQLASDEFGSGEGTLIATTASILATHAANLELFREKEQLMVNTVRVLVSAIESKDKYTHGHSERVALYTRRIAEEVGYSQSGLEDIYLSALLHDVGKIGVPDAVLTKPGRLTDEEFSQIAQHPDEGWSILDDLQQLRHVLPGVLYHHERWDGRGYPDGLAGEAIPLDGRVMAVADAFDAMTSNRPYRQGMPCEKAEAILREGSGTQWDPQCVDAFFACRDDIHRIKDEYVETPRPTRKPGSVEAIAAEAVG